MSDELNAPKQPAFWTDTAGATDELGRDSFARRIADALANQPGDAGMVVALYGPWGSGKSTILQYVQEFIEEGTPESGEVIFIRFNPWFYNTEGQTVADFFKVIASALGKSLDKWNEEAGQRLARLGGLAKGFGFSHAGAQVGGAAVEGLASMIGAPRNLRERYDYLKFLLEDEPAVAKNTRIIIAIDDIDRTDADSIATIFRLMKLGANLPRISYLLAFDEDVVSTALGAKYPAGNADGTSFLEKIVQVPLHLPQADAAQLATILYRDLVGVLESHSVDLSTLDEYELQSRLDACVWPGVQTLRAGKQILNAVTFVIPVMKGEVHVTDQVLVEALRILYPKVYKFIRKHKDFAVEWVTDKSLLEFRATQLNKALKRVDSANRKYCKQLLSALFPAIENMYAARIDGRAEYEKWAQERRACSASYFDRYFTYGLPFGDIFDTDIDAVVEGGAPEPAAALTDLLAKRKPNLVIEKLIERSSTLRDDQAAGLAGVICAVADQLPGYDTPLRFGTLLPRAAYLVTGLMQRVEVARRLIVLGDLLTTTDVRFAVLTFRWLVTTAPRVATVGEPFTAAEIDELGRGLATRLLTAENLRVFYEESPGLAATVVSLCRRFGDGALVPQLLLEVLESSQKATLNFLQVYLPHSQESLPSSPAARAGYEYISGLVPPAKVMELLAQHYPLYIGPFDEQTETGKGLLQLAQYLQAPVNWVYRFAEIYRHYGDYAPLAPPSVYQPGVQKTSPFQNDHPRNKLQSNSDTSDFIARVVLRVPEATGLPGGLAGTTGANLYGSPRESLLIDHLNRSAVTAWFKTWSAETTGAEYGSWRAEGRNSGETSTLVIAPINDEPNSQGRRNALECVVNTGMVSAQRDGQAVNVPGMYICLDLSVGGMGASMLTLDELAQIVVGMLGIVDTAEAVARSLVGNGDYTVGELACMFATGRETLDKIVDIGSFSGISGNSSQKEVEVYSTLPIQSIYPDRDMAAAEVPNEPQIRLAIEFVQKALERAGKRDYLDTLHQMLPRLAEPRSSSQATAAGGETS